MKKTASFFTAGLLFICCAGTVTALNRQTDADSEQTDITLPDSTRITSAAMDFSIQKSCMAFTNNVTLTNSQYKLTCNTLLVSSDKDNKPDFVHAEGNVRLKAENGEMTSQKANYSRSSGQFILEGNVTLQQENNALSADRIIVRIRDGKFDRIHCEGNIRGSFPFEETLPDKKDTRPDDSESLTP